MSNLNRRIGEVVEQQIAGNMRALMDTLNKMSTKNTADAKIVSTGRDTTGSLDASQAIVEFRTGETATVYASARTLRTGDPAVVVGNRVM